MADAMVSGHVAGAGLDTESLTMMLDAVRAQVEALADVRDVEGLRAGIEAVGVSFEQIFTDISETLDCS